MTPFSVGLTWGKLLPELANGPNKVCGEGWAERVEKNNSISLLLNLNFSPDSRSDMCDDKYIQCYRNTWIGRDSLTAALPPQMPQGDGKSLRHQGSEDSRAEARPEVRGQG